MVAEAEGQVTRDRPFAVEPGDVKLIRFVVGVRVAVRAGDQSDHAFSGSEGPAADHELPLGGTGVHVDGRVVTEQLVDGPGDQLRPLAQQLELVGVAQQGKGTVADQVHGRLVTRDDQGDAGAEDFLRGEPVALVLHRGQRTDQVVAGPVPPFVNKLTEVGGELGQRRVAGGQRLGGHVDVGIERARERLRPLLHEWMILGGHAQNLADHGERQRVGHHLDQVELAGVQCGVEKAVDQFGDARPELGHPPRGESLGDQAA